MAVALLGKCVALLGLIVLLYATCYGFRIRDTVQQAQSTSCVPMPGRVCSDRTATIATTTTTGGLTQKWHKRAVSRTASDRKPPAESLGDGTEGTSSRIEKTNEYLRDKAATRFKSSSTESIVVDDDDDDEEKEGEEDDFSHAIVRIEDKEEVEDDEESVSAFERDRTDEEDEDEEEEEEFEIEALDRKKKEGREELVHDEKDNGNNDKEVGRKLSKRDSKTRAEEDEKQIKIAKTVELVKYGEDDDEEEEEEEKVTAGIDQRNKEDDIKKIISKKLEKIRLADKVKAKVVKILPEKSVGEQLKQEEKKPVETTVSAIKNPKMSVESAQKREKPTESAKKPIESSKKSIDATPKSVDNTKKLSEENIKNVESVSSNDFKSKNKVPKIISKIDEKSETRVKLEISTLPPKIKEQSKQSTKADKTKPTLKLSKKEISQTTKQKTKPKTKERTDASLTLSELNDAILHAPTFVPNFTNIEDPECQQHGKIFLRQLRGYKLWALQMLDSSAKIPSSLLRGNVNQLGDYDQCLGVLAHVKVDEKTIRIQGKYCLATVDLQASHPDMKLPVNLMQARAFIRGSMHDPGHFIPKFTTVNWALCLPAACSAQDAERALESVLKDYNAIIGIKFTVEVDSNMCYVKQKFQSYSKETIGVLYFYATIICLAIIATVRDYFVTTQGKGNYSERIIMSFSLRRTIKALLKEETGAADITCIHGIRALATIALYVAHQLITISRIPFSNRTFLTEIANCPVSSILRVSLVYTDAFLLLSGVLSAYNMTKELKTRGEIRWFCRFIARYIRLTPALLAIIFWYAFVMEHVGSGPQWNNVIARNAELCKHNAWTNLLYVQNFFPFEEMCATHTHQLALDMQLSLTAPILVFFLQYKPLIGILLMIFLILVSATLRYIATANNYLSLVIFHGISLKRLYKTANLTYALPLHRATPYIFGVGLGVLLHHTGKNVRMNKILVILGWLITMILGSWSLFSPWRMARRDYVYDAEEATHYAVIGPVLWATALCWSIFACYTENGGVINRFLSNYWLMVFSKISYSVYLTQFAVSFYNIGITRFPTVFQLHRAIDPMEVAIVIVASIVLTLLFDLPMQEMKIVIMESTDVLTLGVFEDKKTRAEDKLARATEKDERSNVYEDDEITTTGWDWQKDIIRVAPNSGETNIKEMVEVPMLKKVNGKRMSFTDRQTDDSADMSNRDRVKPLARRSFRDTNDRRDTNSSRYGTDDSEEEAIEFLRSQREYEIVTQRNRRSMSKTKDTKRLPSKEKEIEEERNSGKETGEKIKEADDYRSWEFVGGEGSTVRNRQESIGRQLKPVQIRIADARRTFSSESEEETAQRRLKPERVSNSEIRMSDEEEWERELRIRRKEFMEKLFAQQRESVGEGEDETSSESLKRRSSAEGKLALLRDDLSADDNMDSWTVSVGPRITLLGSSQEPSEPEEDIYMRRREYREQGPPSREESQSEEEENSQGSSRRQSYTSGSPKTSLEEEDDVSNHNFVLTKESKRESLQDLSRLSQEELTNSGWNVVRKDEEADFLAKPASTGLFKRESIVKSQASEEDPEYLVPERPKLIQQEREHPFKKAWQMQKSRSEEDGSSAYSIKDHKEQRSESKVREEELSTKRERSSEQFEAEVEPFANVETTVILRRKSTDTEENRTSSKSGNDETDSISISTDSRATRDGSNQPSSKSETDEDSAKLNWSGEEGEGVEKNRSKSEEANFDWEQEET